MMVNTGEEKRKERSGRGRITARNVPGKKHIVSTAMAFIAALSFLLSSAIVVEVSARLREIFESFCAINW